MVSYEKQLNIRPASVFGQLAGELNLERRREILPNPVARRLKQQVLHDLEVIRSIASYR
jgi:hypothetical protein